MVNIFTFFLIFALLSIPSQVKGLDAPASDFQNHTNRPMALKEILVSGVAFIPLNPAARAELARTNQQLDALYDLRIAQMATNQLIAALKKKRLSLPPIKPGKNGVLGRGITSRQEVIADVRLNIRARMELPEEREWGYTRVGRGTGPVPGPEVRAKVQQTTPNLLAVFDAHREVVLAANAAMQAQHRTAEASYRGSWTREAEEYRRLEGIREDAVKKLMFARAKVLQEREVDARIESAEKNLGLLNRRIEQSIAIVNGDEYPDKDADGRKNRKGKRLKK